MTLLRTILALVIFVVLVHLGLVYSDIEENLNNLTQGIYSLARLLEVPAQVVVDSLPTSPEQRQDIEEGGIYFVGFVATAGYFILFLLLGVGRR